MTVATNGDVSSHHEIEIPTLNETKEQPPTKVVPIGEGDLLSANGFAPEPVDKRSPELQNGIPPAASYPKSRLDLLDHFIDEPRPLRVSVIGGGLAGILAGILLPIKVPGIRLTIYEKNHDLSGTWLENVYPGVRCDIPSHVYQSTFSPKLDWSDQFAPGAEIRDYWQAQARKYDVYQYAKLGQKVEATDWDESKSVWRLSIRDVVSGEIRVEEAEFVLTALGRFNAWKLPDYPGITEYKGLLRHASHWDPTFDPTGKKVAVIGNGASGIQLVANLQPVVAHLDHYARNRTWIAASWAGDERTLEPQPISEEQKKSFEDPEVYLKFRKELENKYWRRFATFFKDHPDNQALRDQFTEIMRKRLAKKPELLNDIVPDFSPNCRRLTPGPGYLEAITEDNVDYIRTPIKRFTESGIETTDGKHREVDAIFCATGANVDMIPPFPIRANGQELAAAWRPGGKYGYPHTYLGLATPGFPNLLFVHGPHGTGPSGTVPHSVEVQLTYYAKLLRKASREGIKTMSPSQKAADDFIEYADAFFAKTVLSDNCSSWYNGGRPGGRIHGVWPGSAGHVTAVRREPRWEDWEYEYLSDTGNRFHWYFGNGWTRKEADPESDMTPYLQVPEKVDLRDYHESWWSLP
ncbi:FAD/NAD(P)-binding domain-containing protein [Coniochaeta sp. PMI_546]|nr:FAD/NAD(P)-binding domain-containing protein [Coniochaeta sp. PMI_546]